MEFSRAKDEMFVHTDITEAPWYVVEADDKRRARINMISHLLENVPYQHVEAPSITLPPRPPAEDYHRPPRELFRQVPDRAAELLAEDQARSRGGKAKKHGKAAGKEPAGKEPAGKEPAGTAGAAAPAEPATEAARGG